MTKMATTTMTTIHATVTTRGRHRRRGAKIGGGWRRRRSTPTDCRTTWWPFRQVGGDSRSSRRSKRYTAASSSGGKVEAAEARIVADLEPGLARVVIPVASAHAVAAADHDVQLDASRPEHLAFELVLRGRPRTDDDLRLVAPQSRCRVLAYDRVLVRDAVAPAVIIGCRDVDAFSSEEP